MRRFFVLGALVALVLAFVPIAGLAQPALPLTLNGVDGNVSVMGGTTITLVTDPGNGIYEYGTADCSGGVTVVHGSNATVAKAGGTSFGFAPFQAGFVGTCRVGTWTPRPTLTLNGVADNVTVNAGEAITFVTDPAVTIYRYATTDCSGSTTTNYPSGTAVTEPSAILFSVQATWADVSVRSTCFIATWLEAAPTVAPPLTINGNPSSITLTIGQVATFETDPEATIFSYTSADCTGAVNLTSSPSFTSRQFAPVTYSAQAHWTAFPAILSPCLNATWEEAPPPPPPPLTINGVAANATLTVGDVALFETATDASISFFLTADCSGPVASVWTPSFTSTPIEPTAYSVRAFWTANPAVESGCFNATWIAEGAPSPTPAETSIPTGTATPTESPTSTTVPPDPTVTTVVSPTPNPAIAPTRTSGGSALVTGLPETGAGSTENGTMMTLLVATFVGLVIASAGRKSIRS